MYVSCTVKRVVQAAIRDIHEMLNQSVATTFDRWHILRVDEFGSAKLFRP